MKNKRSFNRMYNETRPIIIHKNYTKQADGSVLIEYGNTKVLCNATIQEKVPFFIKREGSGWITAEYAMLPTATHKRNTRESIQGKQKGRTIEIQRLISRSLRSAINLKLLGKRTIILDCDVIEADGGTRSASITGAYVAMAEACKKMLTNNIIKTNPLNTVIAAVSVGIVKKQYLCDLDYDEDSAADSDINVVMNEQGDIVEIQGTAELKPFNQDDLLKLLLLARKSIENITHKQKNILNQ